METNPIIPYFPEIEMEQVPLDKIKFLSNMISGQYYYAKDLSIDNITNLMNKRSHFIHKIYKDVIHDPKEINELNFSFSEDVEFK